MGRGIDIGCGDDVLHPCEEFPKIVSVHPFDKDDGDAQNIHWYIEEETFDFVYSSHCLEHMTDPYKALLRWFRLVKKGGYLIFQVPDEDLYEQGVFPSRWNQGHRHTFTINKKLSWCANSINVVDLVRIVKEDGGQVEVMKLVDTNYDHGKSEVDQTNNFRDGVEAHIEVVLHRKKDEEE